jgi:hypothetical protein
VIGEAQGLTKESFEILDPTIRTAGSEIWIEFNPKFEDDFVYDRFVTNTPENAIVEQVNYVDNPWCPEELKKQAATMLREDKALWENVWMGKPLGQGGRVYPMYDPEVHEIDFDLTLLPQCNLYMSIDPHRKYYPAIMWYAVTPTNLTVVYNEFPKYEDLGMWYDEARNSKQFELTAKELANVVLANDLTTQYGGYVRARTGDPHFFAEFPDFTRGLMEFGVNGWIDSPFERVEQQRDALKSLLNYNPALPLTAINYPDLLVHRACKNVGRALRRHTWDEKRDKEAETHKDFPDSLRYFLSLFNGKPVYIEPPKPSHARVQSLSEYQLSTLPIRNFGK